MRRGFVVLTFIASAALEGADVAPDPLTTGGTSLVPHVTATPVEMSWEEVDLWPSAEKNRVKAVFGLKNPSGKDVELEVGFPSYFEMPLNDFALEIDGQKQLGDVKKELYDGRRKVFTYWMCWPMKFAAGQQRQVTVSYWVKTERAFSELFVDDLPEELRRTHWGYESGYVLRTGAGWASTIGKATIRLHYGDNFKRSWLRLVWPREWTYDAVSNTDTLVLTNFEPNEDSDIRYRFYLCSPEEELAGFEKALKEKRLGLWAQQRLLDRLEAEPKQSPYPPGSFRYFFSVGEGRFDLPAEERSRRALGAMTWMVPPNAPEIDPEPLTNGQRGVLHGAYRRLFRHYLATHQPEKARTLAAPYARFLNVMMKQVEHHGHKYEQLTAEYDALKPYLDLNR